MFRNEFFSIAGLLFLVLVELFLAMTRKRPKITKSLKGKVALVTGGTKGIGHCISLDLAARGCTVIMASRNDSENVTQNIIEESGNPNVYFKKLDLSNFASVRKFSIEVAESVEKLDILVNNAGISGNLRMEKPTDGGFSPVMKTNYFGPFLLTHLLLNLLKKSPQGRILFLTSSLAFLGRLDPEKLNAVSRYNYTDSKLAIIMASDYFAKELSDTRITSNAFHPGLVKTRLLNVALSNGLLVWLFGKCLKGFHFFVGKDPWDVAEWAAYYVSAPNLDKTTGRLYLEDREFCKPSATNDKEFVRKCIKATGKLINIPVYNKEY